MKIRIEKENFILRNLEEDDINQFADTLLAEKDVLPNLRQDYPQTPEDLRQFTIDKIIINLVIEINGTIAGGISLKEINDNTMYFSRLWIARMYRVTFVNGADIVKALIEYVSNEFNTKYIHVQIYAFNEKMIKHISRLGFHRIPEESITVTNKNGEVVEVIFFAYTIS